MGAGYEKILIAIDASDEAEDVLRTATELDPRQLEKFRVITVIPPVLGGIGGVDGMSFAASWPLHDLEAQLQRAITANNRDRIAQFGIAPDQAAVAVGRPASEIRAYADKIAADLIVIGSHGRHGIAGILGSTANGVVHGTARDVLVVRVG
jgi:universal stress protein A